MRRRRTRFALIESPFSTSAGKSLSGGVEQSESKRGSAASRSHRQCNAASSLGIVSGPSRALSKLEQGKLDAMAIAVAAHPPRLILPAFPVILLLVLDFTAHSRQSFCLQRAGALVEDAAEKLRRMREGYLHHIAGPSDSISRAFDSSLR